MAKSLGKRGIVLKEADLEKRIPHSFKKHKWELSRSGKSTKEQIHLPIKRRMPRHKQSLLDELE